MSTYSMSPFTKIQISEIGKNNLSRKSWYSGYLGIRKNGKGHEQDFSAQFRRSVVSNSLQPHGRSTPGFPVHQQLLGVYLNSCPLSQWCHSTISSSVALFFSCPQSSPGCFPVNWLFPTGGQRIGASASVLPMNIQGWFPLGLTGLNSLQSKGLLKVFSNTIVRKHQFFSAQPSIKY